MRSAFTLAATVAALHLLFPFAVDAQDDPSTDRPADPTNPPAPPVARPENPPTPPPPPPPAVAENPDTAATNDPVEPEVIRTERSIYLPYDDLTEIFEDNGRGVFLPYREFLDLWNQLQFEKEEEPVEPPTDGVISSATYTAAVEGDENKVLAIEAVLEAESFRDDGWAVIPLVKTGIAISEAEAGEATIHLGKDGYELLLPRKGRYTITLRLFAKITEEAGGQSASLDLPRAGVARFEASLPGRDWDFEIQPGAAYSTRPGPDDSTRLSFFFGETGSFDVSWRKRGEDSGLEPLLFVETAVTSSVVPGALRTEIELDYRILRAPVEAFSLFVPEGQEILNVEGENIREWNIGEAGDQQRLDVSLHAPAREAYELTLTLEEAIDALPTEFSIPQVRAENVVRQRGTIDIGKSRELEVETVTADGVTQQSLVGAEEDSGTAANDPRPHERYRYLSLPFNLALTAREAEPLIEVDSATRFVVDTDTARFLSRFDYEIKRAGIFSTRITLPDDFEGIDVFATQRNEPDPFGGGNTGTTVIADPVEDFVIEEEGDARVLVVTFRNRTEGRVSFQVSGRLVRDGAEASATVPVFEPLGVERHDAKVGLQIHGSLDPRTESEGDLRQQDVSLLEGQIPGVGPLQIGFRYRDSAEPATIAFTAKKPQVTGEVFTLVEVREELVRTEWKIAYAVRYAGVDTFVVAVPEAIAGDLRHDGDLIKEVIKNYTPTDEEEIAPAGEGVVLWAIVLRDKKTGPYELSLTLTQPIEEASHTGSAAEAAGENTDAPESDPVENQNFTVNLPVISLRGVQTETGQIAVIKDDNLEILDADTASLEPIDPLELRGDLGRPGVFLAYQYRRHPLSLAMDVSRNEFLPVPQALVTYASLTTVVSRDRALTCEVVYWVKNNAKQFFSVSLPEGGRMVSDIYVDGQPRQPMRRAGEDVVLIRLPAGKDRSSSAFPIRFVYEVPSPRPGRRLPLFGKLVVPTVTLKDAGILQSRIVLFLPRDYRYHTFRSAMELPLRERGWTHFRNAFDWLVPALGPQVPASGAGRWQDPPSLPESAGGGFDLEIPTEGRRHTLHRLDAPDTVSVSFRSGTFALLTEALAGLATFVLGLLFVPRQAKWRFAFFAGAGLLPLVIAGAVSPGAAPFWTAIYLGAFFAALVWLAGGAIGIAKRLLVRVWRFLTKPRPKRPAKEKSAPPEGSEPADDSKPTGDSDPGDEVETRD